MLAFALAAACWGNEPQTGLQKTGVSIEGGDPDTIRLPVLEGGDIRFERLRRSQGLSHQRVIHIVQDDRGFLWFGTQFGLNRYDGYHFRIFRNDPDDPRSVCGVIISSLFIDRSGQLWVGCDYAVDRYDPVAETFVHYRLAAARSPSDSVRHITQDRQGFLWLSTGNGLYRLNSATGEIAHFGHHSSGLSSDDVRSSGEDRLGGFWVATSEGLDAFDRNHGRVTQQIPLAESRDFSFFEDRAGVFWVLYASGNGLAALDRKTGHLTRFSFGRENLPSRPLTGVSSMLEDHNGTLWIGTFSDGLLKFDRQRQRFIRYRNDPSNNESLSEDRITTLFEDHEGDIWVGFGATEPAFFPTRPTPFEVLPFDARNPANLGETLVNGIYEDREGILWMGTTGSLVRLDRRSGRYTHIGVPGNGIESDVLSVVEDSTGALWIGTSGQGLYRRSTGSERLTAFRHDDADPTSLSNNTVIRLLIDHAGFLWAATVNGLNRYNSRTQNFTVFRRSPRGESDNYNDLAEDPEGALWLGSYGNGVVRFEPQSGRFTPLRGRAEGETLGDARISSLLIDHTGALWAGTQNGIDRFDRAAGWVAHYSDKQGLAGIAVSCILEDPSGALWFGTSAGLSRLDPERQTFRNYSQADGLPGPDFTGWRACFRNSAGEIFMGGFSGAVAFHPETLIDFNYTPAVALTAFQLGGKPVGLGAGSPLKRAIDYTDEFSLSHDESSFSFEFSALSFSSPSTNRYRYKLEGLDERWHLVGSDRRYASYTTLPAGAYRFRVQAATSRGPWSEPGLAVRIRIEPAWWATWWFRALCLAVTLAAIAALYLARVRQLHRQFETLLKARESERARIARDLHDSLLQGFQGLLFRLQAARNLLPQRPVDAAHALETAMDVGDKAMEEGREAVQHLRAAAPIANDLADSVSALGSELGLPGEGGVPSYHVLVEGQPQAMVPVVRDEIYKVAREAIRNAAGHARARRIEAELVYGESDFCLRIRDDGTGIEPKVLEQRRRPGHWGLQGMRERAESFGGRFSVWSEAGAGTEIELLIPARVCYASARLRTI